MCNRTFGRTLTRGHQYRISSSRHNSGYRPRAILMSRTRHLWRVLHRLQRPEASYDARYVRRLRGESEVSTENAKTIDREDIAAVLHSGDRRSALPRDRHTSLCISRCRFAKIPKNLRRIGWYRDKPPLRIAVATGIRRRHARGQCVRGFVMPEHTRSPAFG